MSTSQAPTVEIRIADLRTSDELQCRVDGINAEVVEDYTLEYIQSAVFPPLTVYRDDDVYWVVDGRHRLEAARRAGRLTITCQVYDGDFELARWQSLHANTTNGLRRSHRDTQEAISRALQHPLGVKLSDSQIAVHVGCSSPTVRKYREQLEADSKILKSDQRMGRDGRTIQTANIGKRENSVRITPPPATAAEVGPLPDLPNTSIEDKASRRPQRSETMGQGYSKAASQLGKLARAIDDVDAILGYSRYQTYRSHIIKLCNMLQEDRDRLDGKSADRAA